jgi:Zn-dependent peptidase ImmA (M78 family)
MTSWAAAHRVAQIRAVQVHADLGLDRSVRVDVFDAIRRAGIVLNVRPLPRLFGAYLAQPDAPVGILINADLDETTRRHTAAHELGHHFFRHATTVDGDLDQILSRKQQWPMPELLAEAFAAWFLMPRRAVQRAMERLEVTRVHDPLEVYQIALLLGTSYRGTVRHLYNLRLATSAQAEAWTAVPVGKLKDQLDRQPVARGDRRSNVWLLDHRFHGHCIEAERGDRLIVQLPPPRGSAGWQLMTPPGLTSAASSQLDLISEHGSGPGSRFVVDIPLQATATTYTLEAEDQVDGGDSWRVHISVVSPRRGVLFP